MDGRQIVNQSGVTAYTEEYGYPKNGFIDFKRVSLASAWSNQ
jgi:hypothetical protein